MSKSTTRILILHNTYLHKGGEDTVVTNEIACLKKNGYTVFYKEFSNASFQKKNLASLLFPLSTIFNWYAFFEVLFFLRKHRITVFHAHNIFYKATPAVFWAAKWHGAKTILTIHNYRLFCLNATFFRNNQLCFDCHQQQNFKSGLKNKCFKNSYWASLSLASSLRFNNWIHTWQNKVDQFIVVNEFSKELLIQSGIKESKIQFKHNFLIEIPTVSTAPKKDFYLFVGRLSEEKGIRHLLTAFSELHKPLFMIGDGELSYLVEQSKNDLVQWLGIKSKPEVFELMQQCKALLFPSIWIEGMPMTIIEAQCLGTIPIVAKLVNTEKMIVDGVDGFLYEPANELSLMDAIHRFEQLSPDKLLEMRNNARNKALRIYTEDAHMELISEIYNN
jgi:glycosyltransferase involved in cell wall biosynthesis